MILFVTLLSVSFGYSYADFIFFPQKISIYSLSDYYDLLCCTPKSKSLQNISQDFLWHLKIPTIGLLPKHESWKFASRQGEGVKIALLDSAVYNQQKINDFLLENEFNGAIKTKFHRWLLFDQENHTYDESLGGASKDSTCRKIDAVFFRDFLQKQHGSISYTLIKQLAPQVKIISIPILNDHGFADKQSLLQGLNIALKNQVNIVHLGLKINHVAQRKKQKIDLDIMQLLKKFDYVVAASGNDFVKEKTISYPARYDQNIISVGSFKYANGALKHSDFSQWELLKGPHFILPGERILCPLWCSEINNFIFIHIAGTSLSAAFMSGFLAVVLAENQSFFAKSKIKIILQTCTKKIKQPFGLYGIPDMPEILSCLKELKGMKKNQRNCWFKKYAKMSRKE